MTSSRKVASPPPSALCSSWLESLSRRLCPQSGPRQCHADIVTASHPAGKEWKIIASRPRKLLGLALIGIDWLGLGHASNLGSRSRKPKGCGALNGQAWGTPSPWSMFGIRQRAGRRGAWWENLIPLKEGQWMLVRHSNKCPPQEVLGCVNTLSLENELLLTFHVLEKASTIYSPWARFNLLPLLVHRAS